MAKRKRLSPALSMHLAVDGPGDAPPLPGPAPRAPIADVAGGAAAQAALSDLAEEMAAARRSGRMVVALPLSAIEAAHLVRDRIALDPDELATLEASIAARGQQTPIEVEDLGDGRYGLISGWRRLTALRGLHASTGEARFGSVLALIRRPEDVAEAYRAMVEENEIRAGLSFYERARIAVLATEKDIFPDTEAAVVALYGAVSRPRRSKIRSFVTVVESLDGHLRFPQAIPERLGLALAKKISAERLGGGHLVLALTAGGGPETEEEERRILEDWLAGTPAAAQPQPSAKTSDDAAAGQGEEIAPGLRLAFRKGRILITGPGVTDSIRDDLAAWLAQRG